VRLHREVRGDGATVLLVHAGIADSRMWEPLAARELRGAEPPVRIAGAAHLPGLERPDEVAEVLVPFLSRHAPA
jgi:hypothetical protein